MDAEQDGRKDLIRDRLNTGQEAFLTAVAALDSDELGRAAWTDGGHWTAQQLIAHVAHAEDSMRALMAATIAGTADGPNPDFDIDRFNEGRLRRSAGADLPELLAHLSRSREETLRFLDQIADDDLDRPAYHPVVKETTIEGIFRVIGFHQRTHAKELRALHGRPATA